MSQLQIFIKVKYNLKLLKSLKRSNFVPSHFYAYFAKYLSRVSFLEFSGQILQRIVKIIIFYSISE